MTTRPNLTIKTEAQRRDIKLRMSAPAEFKTAERLRKRIAGIRGIWATVQSRDDASSLAIAIHSRRGDDFSPLRVVAVYANGQLAQRIAPVSIGNTRHYDPQADSALAARQHATSLYLIGRLRRMGHYAEARSLLKTAASWRTQENA